MVFDLVLWLGSLSWAAYLQTATYPGVLPSDLDFHKTGQGMSSPAPEGKRFNAPPPPANHLMTRPRPKSVHAMNLNSTSSSLSASVGSIREGSPNPKTHTPSPRLTTTSIQGPKTLSRQNSLSNSSSKIMELQDGAKNAKTSSQTAHSDSHLDTNRDGLRKDLSQRYSWNDRPLRMDSSSTALATPLTTSMSSSYTSPLAQDSLNSARVNGDMGRRISVEGDAISDTMSEPGTLNRTSLRRIKSSRSTTPPPKPPLPNAKSVHSDVYNTVFALQSLGDGAWADYLTTVRNLMEGNMSKSYSIPSGDMGSAGGSRDNTGMHRTLFLLPNTTKNPPYTTHTDCCGRNLLGCVFVVYVDSIRGRFSIQ